MIYDPGKNQLCHMQLGTLLLMFMCNFYRFKLMKIHFDIQQCSAVKKGKKRRVNKKIGKKIMICSKIIKIHIFQESLPLCSVIFTTVPLILDSNRKISSGLVCSVMISMDELLSFMKRWQPMEHSAPS